MIRLLAIDDEPLALRLLEVYIEKTPGVSLLAACTFTQEAIPWLEQADALLVDINMPDINGMEFVRSLDDPPLVIFTTAYSEYAVEGFRVNAVDYLLKPFSLNEFQSAIGKLAERLAMKRQNLQQQRLSDVINLSTAHRNVRLETAKIRYVEGMGEYLKIHLTDEPSPVIVLYRMKNLQELLPEDFLRIHKSYIVALGRIRQTRRNAVTLDDGTNIPIGDSYRDEFKSRYSALIS